MALNSCMFMWRDLSQADQAHSTVNLPMWAPQSSAEPSVTRIFDGGAEAKETPLQLSVRSIHQFSD